MYIIHFLLNLTVHSINSEHVLSTFSLIWSVVVLAVVVAVAAAIVVVAFVVAVAAAVFGVAAASVVVHAFFVCFCFCLFLLSFSQPCASVGVLICLSMSTSVARH